MKIRALARISLYMNPDQRKILMNAFITSHFNYCPLVWMMHSRQLNNRINQIHERALRIVYQDFQSTFEQLLLKDKSLTIHQRNIKLLAFEMFRAKNNSGPKITNEIFMFERTGYDLRNEKFKSYRVRSVHYGTETLSYLGPKIWNMLPNRCRQATSAEEFKREIKKWIPDNCPCRLCKNYVNGVGFI